MSDEQRKQFYQVYELMCSGRIYAARELLEALLDIPVKEKA